MINENGVAHEAATMAQEPVKGMLEDLPETLQLASEAPERKMVIAVFAAAK